jgi:hypothetical protein
MPDPQQLAKILHHVQQLLRFPGCKNDPRPDGALQMNGFHHGFFCLNLKRSESPGGSQFHPSVSIHYNGHPGLNEKTNTA